MTLQLPYIDGQAILNERDAELARLWRVHSIALGGRNTNAILAISEMSKRKRKHARAMAMAYQEMLRCFDR